MPRLSAQVIVKNALGSSVLDAKRPIATNATREYSVTRNRMQKVAEIFERLGLQPVQIGAASITVEGDQATFEELFQCGIERKNKKVMNQQQLEVDYYRFKGNPNIPEELREFVAAIALPEPPELSP